MILPIQMTGHMNFTGQRADKVLVKGIVGPVEYIDANGVTREGIAKEVERYTVSCDECGCIGRYDERGEIVCQGCGLVLSGDNTPTLAMEYGGTGDSDTPGESRGLGTLGNTQGTTEPRV